MKKLLVCDVEGTIFKAQYKIDGTDFASTMWQPLAKSLGEAAIDEERETHRKWESKEYNNYADWVEATVQIHKKYGLHRDTFYSLINDAEYNSGVVEFFEQLNRDEYIPVLISGGFEELIERAMRDLKIFYGFGACEYFFDETDGLLAGHRIKHCDFEDKYTQLESILRRFKLNATADWVFIGDGKNDKYIASKAPFSLGINPHPELAKVVDHNIDCFSKAAEFIENAPVRPYPYTSELDGLLIENKSLTTRIKELEKDLKKFGTDASVREERLSIEVHNLRTRVRELNQRVNDLKGVRDIKDLAIENHIAVNDSDYSLSPKMSLKQILDEGYRIMLFGFQESHSTFQAFAGYHKNFRIRSGFDESYNQKELKSFDFIFEFIDNMSHDIDKKNNSIRDVVPYSKLQHHESMELLENAIANILLRYFSET